MSQHGREAAVLHRESDHLLFLMYQGWPWRSYHPFKNMNSWFGKMKPNYPPERAIPLSIWPLRVYSQGQTHPTLDFAARHWKNSIAFLVTCCMVCQKLLCTGERPHSIRLRPPESWNPFKPTPCLPRGGIFTAMSVSVNIDIVTQKAVQAKEPSKVSSMAGLQTFIE